jgi:hypothetical protein
MKLRRSGDSEQGGDVGRESVKRRSSDFSRTMIRKIIEIVNKLNRF